jgi:hypothetical protein
MEDAMGFFSNLTRSWKKSSRLQELQKIIAPPNRNTNDVISEFRRSLASGMSEKDRALEEFLDLCESDDGVKKIMENEHISRIDLKQLYVQLSAAGLGQWINGHYAALSSIAYVEPLQYLVRAQKKGGNLGVRIAFLPFARE